MWHSTWVSFPFEQQPTRSIHLALEGEKQGRKKRKRKKDRATEGERQRDVCVCVCVRVRNVPRLGSGWNDATERSPVDFRTVCEDRAEPWRMLAISLAPCLQRSYLFSGLAPPASPHKWWPWAQTHYDGSRERLARYPRGRKYIGKKGPVSVKKSCLCDDSCPVGTVHTQIFFPFMEGGAGSADRG